MTVYIYSTLSAPVEYTVEGSPELIRIDGGAGIPDKKFVTARGLVTDVTDEQYAALKKNHVFRLHEENGYITADTKKHDADEVAGAMNEKDQSKPDTKESLAAEGMPAPAEEKKRGRPAKDD